MSNGLIDFGEVYTRKVLVVKPPIMPLIIVLEMVVLIVLFKYMYGMVIAQPAS